VLQRQDPEAADLRDFPKSMGWQKVKENMSSQGTLFIIAAASGTGKTSLVNALLKTVDNIKVSTSHTTRPIRPGEKDKINYYFVSEAEFKHLIKQGAFLEYAFVHGKYYGTSKQWVEDQLAGGTDVILEIDWQGAQQVKKLYPKSVSIFILPPSREVLQNRLKARQQDKPEVIIKRLAMADSEIAHYREFDFLIINDDFEKALIDLVSIIHANRLKTDQQAEKFSHLLAQLVQN
jgi:guanylate kinase